MKCGTIKVRKSVMLGVCLACMILLTSCQTGETVATLDLSRLLKDDMFCYPGLEWDSSQEDVQDNTGLTFGEPVRLSSVTAQRYLDARTVKLYGVEGLETYTFEKGELKSVFIDFGSKDGKAKINEFSEMLIDDIKENYGQSKEQEVHSFAYWGGNMGVMRSYQWQYIMDDGTKSQLLILVAKDKKKDTNFVRIQFENPNYPTKLNTARKEGGNQTSSSASRRV